MVKRLGTQASRILAKAGVRLGVAAATGAAGGSVVPGPGTAIGAGVGIVVGVGMAAWTAFDLFTLAKEALPLATDLVKGLGNAINVKPDIAILNRDGGVKKIFDYKFPGDRYRNGQDTVFEAAAPEGSDPINRENCNNCKAGR